MKISFLSLLFLILLSVPSHAWTPVESKKLCTLSREAFEMFKKESYQPVITSQLQSVLLAVWLNPRKDVLVTTTVGMPGQTESLTCIMTVGTQNTYVDLDSLSELDK